MATSGELVRTVASALELPEATVALVDRQLSEAGLRTKGGRGRSAAHMTEKDAAAVLLASVCSMSVTSAVDDYLYYSNLQSRSSSVIRRGSKKGISRYFLDVFDRAVGESTLQRWEPARSVEGSFKLEPFDLPYLQQLPSDHTFGDAVAAVLLSYHEGRLDQQLESASEIDRPHGRWPVMLTIGHPRFLGCSIEIQGRDWSEFRRYGAPVHERQRTRFSQLRYVYSSALRMIAGTTSPNPIPEIITP